MLDVNGIGFDVQISLNTYSAIQSLDEGQLFTYLKIQEDAHVLYGFAEKAERDMFVLLISVSGVGAATARMMLSAMQAHEAASAIASGNVKLLESIKGIGKKTAERIVLELREKAGGMRTAGSQSSGPGINRPGQDATAALVSLGIGNRIAETAVEKILKAEGESLTTEELIKRALKVI